MSPTELHEHCEKWSAIASSTKPADRKRVERNFKRFYTAIFKADPPPFFWAISPRDAKKVRAPLCGKEGEKWYSTNYDMPRSIIRTIQETIQKLQPQPELEAAVDRIRHPLDFGRGRLPMYAWSDRPTIGEHNDLRVAALLDFCLSDRDPRHWLVRAMRSWLYVVASCKGIYTMDRGIIFMETPEVIRADDENGWLHFEGGPALRFRDGHEYHFLHGVRVPERYVFARSDEITLPEVLAERNAEVRMTLISRMGFDKLLGTVRHWTISEANGNRLIEFRVKGTHFLRALHLKWRDKTGDKETVIPVPSKRSYFGADCPDDIDDCEQVRRWTLGWPKEALAVAET